MSDLPSNSPGNKNIVPNPNGKIITEQPDGKREIIKTPPVINIRGHRIEPRPESEEITYNEPPIASQPKVVVDPNSKFEQIVYKDKTPLQLYEAEKQEKLPKGKDEIDLTKQRTVKDIPTKKEQDQQQPLSPPTIELEPIKIQNSDSFASRRDVKLLNETLIVEDGKEIPVFEFTTEVGEKILIIQDESTQQFHKIGFEGIHLIEVVDEIVEKNLLAIFNKNLKKI